MRIVFFSPQIFLMPTFCLLDSKISNSFLLLKEFNFVFLRSGVFVVFYLDLIVFLFSISLQEYLDTKRKYFGDNAMCHIFQILASICILRVINGKYSYVKLCCKSAKTFIMPLAERKLNIQKRRYIFRFKSHIYSTESL